MKATRIVLADDHVIMRAGLRSWLEEREGIEVVGEASDGREALKLIAQTSPDIVLMDIGMRGLNGLDATERVRTEFPAVRVIILSMHENDVYVVRALQAGARGYVLKDAEPEELTLALKVVAQGKTYLSPSVSRVVLTEYLRRLSHSQDEVAIDPNTQGENVFLTARQREILQLIAEGHTNKEIGGLLHLSEKTVETHRLQIMRRLDIHDVPGLVRYAIRHGLVSSDR